MSSNKCCGAPADPLQQVRELYTTLALQPERDFGWGKGKENARRLGYDPDWLARLPDEVWASAAAVGNPFSLGPIWPGETVLDLGCGAGADLCIAALLVGPGGRAVGLDITPAMVAKARDNAMRLDLRQVEVHEADMTRIPLESDSVDVVIANGSINLSLDKELVLREIHRVLRRGGRLQLADMVRDGSVPEATTSCGDTWADCVSGTLAPERLLELLGDTGFSEVELVAFTGYRTAPTTNGALIRATKPARPGSSRHRPAPSRGN